MAPEASPASLPKLGISKGGGSNGFGTSGATPPPTPSRAILEGIVYRESGVIPGVAKKRYFVLYP
jgi:hypothetical protein